MRKLGSAPRDERRVAKYGLAKIRPLLQIQRRPAQNRCFESALLHHATYSKYQSRNFRSCAIKMRTTIAETPCPTVRRPGTNNPPVAPLPFHVRRLRGKMTQST